jgi:hypothetical protein
MKNSLFCSMTATGVLAVLALCTPGYAADVTSARHSAAPAIAAAAPGERVVLHFEGAERISMDGSGRLEVLEADGAIRRYRPALFQTIDGKHRIVTYSCHVVDHDHVELKAVHPNPSAPVELAPVHPVATTS